MQCTLVLLPFVFSLVVVAAHQINITKDYELEEFMCSGTQLLNDTTVKLSTNISHIIRNASFCIINTTYSLSIISNSSQQAVIQCNDSSGLAFTNIHNLTLQRLVFKRCGGYLKGLELKIFTILPFNLTQYHSAVSLFLHIKALVIKEVNITRYYGFAMFAINPMNATIDHCEVSLSYGGNHFKHKKGYGSGIFLLFANITELPSSTSNVSIHQNTFHHNFEYNHETENICLGDHLNPMVNAASLTIYYIHNSFAVIVNVTQSNFYYNQGHAAAGILIKHYNSALQSQTRIINSTFRENFNNKNKLHIKKHKINCPGSDLLLHFYISNDNIQCSNDISHPLIVSKSFFSGHKTINRYDQGIIYMNIFNPSTLINVIITFNEVHFESIIAHGRGSCLYAVSDASPHNVQIIMKDITAVKNSQFSERSFYYAADHKSIFAIENFDILYLSGNSSYMDNNGSVFSAINTKVILSGQLLFENNTGIMGTAFSLIGSSRFILQDGLVAVFNGNLAYTTGGAIYAYNDITNECMFTPNGSNISMLFRHNTATYSGNSIFSNNLYNCSTLPDNLPVQQAKELYQNISNGTLNEGLSTIVIKLCACYPNTSNCTKLDDVKVDLYPGMKLYLSIAAFDAFNQITYTEISLYLLTVDTLHKHRLPSLNWYIDSNSRTLSQGKSTLVNIPLFKRHNIVGFPYLELAIIASIIPQYDQHFYIHLLPSGCPVGFEFDQLTHRCECSHVFYKLGYQPVCKITSDGYNPHITIKLTVKSLSNWIGVINSINKTNFGVSNVCYRYCNYNSHYDTFIIHENMVMLTNSDDDYSKKVNLCSHNREGPLCSQCAPGYSSVFGSVYHCKQCSNWWLFTLLVYGIAGPLLIYFLHAFHLTLTTGKINAIIFYAQILNINVPVLENKRITLKTIYITVKGLLFLINLNIAFDLPLCLYDGMTELWKSGIGLMFPVYLLTIVIGLIIISRYSVRLSNRIANSSVQVLVTVVHLSFTTLLSSVLDVFTPAYIYTNTSDIPLKVWQNDATVKYGKGGHLILMIVTGVVVGSILITYLTVLLAGRPLMKINKVREYLRPIYEAIHAPYKRNKEFFFSSSIIFVVFLYLLSATLLSNNPNLGLMIGIPVTCIYISVVGYSRPFKDKRLNILNVFIFSIIIALTGSTWSFINSPAINVLSIIVVILCHITVIITLLCIFMSQFAFVKKFFRKAKTACISKRSHHSAVHQRDMMRCDSFYQSCSEREPLLVDK